MKVEKELPYIIRDSREKRGYTFRLTDKCKGTIEKKLDVGDYSLKGHESIIAIERKATIEELWNNFGQQRERFFAEFERMKDIKFKYLILEFSYLNILKGTRYSKISPNFIISNLQKLELEHNVKIIYAGDRSCGQDVSRRILLKVWNYIQDGRISGL